MDNTSSQVDDCEISFFPPLWQQRMYHVTCILREHKVKSVLDLGTGEGKFLAYLRNEKAIHSLVGVDFDSRTLEDATRVLIFAQKSSKMLFFLEHTTTFVRLHQHQAPSLGNIFV